jgi:hypothetical protein
MHAHTTYACTGFGEMGEAGTFARFEDEGNAVPSFIFDVEGYCGECGTSRIFRDGIVIQVAWFISITDVLADNNIFWIDGGNRSEDTHLPSTSTKTRGKWTNRVKEVPSHHEYPQR